MIEHANIETLLVTRQRRANPDLPKIDDYTILRPTIKGIQRTVKGVIFDVRYSKDAHQAQEITVHIGDSTGVMGIDLHEYRDDKVWKVLESKALELLNRGRIHIEVTGKVDTSTALFPMFQIDKIVSMTRPSVRELRTLARAYGVKNRSQLRKPQLVRAVMEVQRDLYCRNHFLSGQGNNHGRCTHA